MNNSKYIQDPPFLQIPGTYQIVAIDYPGYSTNQPGPIRVELVNELDGTKIEIYLIRDRGLNMRSPQDRQEIADLKQKLTTAESHRDYWKKACESILSACTKLAKDVENAKAEAKANQEAIVRLNAHISTLKMQGSATERDQYSKAINAKDTQISQIRKEAKKWKDAALEAQEKVKELEAKAEYSLQVWQPYRGIEIKAGRCQVSAGPIPAVSALDKLTDTVNKLDARVAKLEQSDTGFPMETIPDTDFEDPDKRVLLYMGGEWVMGGTNRYAANIYCTPIGAGGRSFQWDKDNQPTRWKPLPS